MFLQKLEIVGFKSFAERTELDFLPPSSASKGITSIVGPNGSGKSNAADAIRWVLGEQSIKVLRGKKAEDVIFSGSERRSRSGFAEVTLHLNNEDGALPLEQSEVAISRRVYRDGDSEYLLNKSKVRLTDIQLLLAQGQVGARSYSVIGQGAIDSVLVATPQERKEFFDEAAGVRQFQLKRHQSEIKLDGTRENLAQAEMLMNEIEPRLRSLARQVKKLEERGSLEEELHAITHEYYGRLWTDLKRQIDARMAALAALEGQWKERDATRSQAQSELGTLEVEETKGDGFATLQTSYEKLLEERSRLREREMQLRSRIEIANEVQKRTAATLPLSKIIEEIGAIGKKQDAIIEKLRKISSVEDAKALAEELDAVRGATVSLKERLERPAPETSPAPKQDPALAKELAEIAVENGALAERLRSVQTELQAYGAQEQKKKERFFALQRGLQEKISAAHDLERKLNDERVEMARLETRRETLEQEMAAELGERADRVKENFTPTGEEGVESLSPQIQKLKYQLQLIGGIDPEAVKEHDETKNRYEYLDGQVSDLRKGIEDLEHVIAELDITIKARSAAAFRNLNRDFDRYFKMLFGGGHAELIQIRAEDEQDEEDEGAEAKSEERRAEETAPKQNRDQIVGIDIHATPPGKKIKNITMLSGGERALTSIALICAIMVTNPSPFVVLDEVDAALDESNAAKFAGILKELAERTQFIIITHNRYTMREANVLYGVTMREDGTSMLLSINLDEVGDLKNANRAKMPV